MNTPTSQPEGSKQRGAQGFDGGVCVKYRNLSHRILAQQVDTGERTKKAIEQSGVGTDFARNGFGVPCRIIR